MDFDLIIIGGGAAGMMCAAQAAQNGVKTCIIEKNKKLGKKLRITGKGRCNVTNACDRETLLNNIISGKKFLMSAFSRFNPDDVMNYFENLGVPLKIERGNRVFPVSDNANDIADALENRIKSLGVAIIHEKCVDVIPIEDNKIKIILENKRVLESRFAVIATGGLSYSGTGSTGDGYIFAKKTGHNVTEILPCLVPIEVDELELCRDMMGLSLKNIRLTLFENNKKIYSDIGEMLFAHFGLTGPLVLSASAYITNLKEKNYVIEINMKPGLDDQKLDARILRDFAESPNRAISNVLHSLLPSKMILPILEISGISPEQKVNCITKKQRQQLENNISHMKFTVKKLRPVEEAIVTAGGVDLKQLNPKSMESKLYKGIYFIGECIDAHGYTGGFNLQIAFSTAFAAANSISENISENLK